MGVKALYFNSTDIGKHVKKTKKRFVWKFAIDGKEHIVDLVISYLSGKKKISQNGRVVYEGKKVLTNSFQYPFEIDLNMCNIVQLGDNFDLRINNQPFAELYEQGGSRGGYGGEYASYSSKGDSFSSKTSGSYGGYSSTSCYQGGSNKSGSNFSQGKRPNENPVSKSRGWEDVRQAAQGVRSNTKDFDFDQRNDFGYENKKSHTSEARTGFDDFGSQNKPTKGDDFTDFTSFNSFSNQNKPQSQDNAFANFGNSSQTQPKQPEVQKPQVSKQASIDILGLDFSGGAQSQNPAPTQQTGNFDDFFGQPAQPTNSGPSQPSNDLAFSQPQTQTQPQVNSNDLLALDFGTPSTQATTLAAEQTTSTQPQDMDLFSGQQQPQIQTPTAQQSQPQPSKKDLWDTDLVSLNPSEVEKKPAQNYGAQSQYDFGNKQASGFGGGFGNQGFNNGLGGNMNYSANAGFGGQNNNTGFGGMNNSGFGNNPTPQSNFGYGNGFQQQPVYNNQPIAGGSVSTPFDF